ncbi:MAG: sensor histidine kinase [Candidatus Hydrogenedentes bacterium]|nr:sensor histidine kinase [Candidatus Hydrogenedentota bacterium]
MIIGSKDELLRQPPADFSRLRIAVVAALAVALSLELVARYMSTVPSPRVMTESVSLVAVIVLSAAALYPIFSLQELRTLKWLMSAAAFSMLTSQTLNILDDVRALDGLFFIGRDGALHDPVKNISLLIGIIAMVAALNLALVETVSIQTTLLRERAELSQEVAVRRRAEAALTEFSGQIRRLSAHAALAREEERGRIARDLHDELGQVLTLLRIDLAGVDQQVQELRPMDAAADLSARLRAMTALVGETMQNVRRIMTELRPGILDDLGITAAIQWQAKEFEKLVGLPCRVTMNTDHVELGQEKSTAMFRILQEALTNVARHARAQAVEIQLNVNDNTATLEIADDGKGIADLRAVESNSFGLLGIRERTLQFRGDCSIRSAVGAGTKITVTLPLDPEAEA